MKKIQAQAQNIHDNLDNARCRHCQTKITAEDDLMPSIDYRATEILILNQQIQNLQGENERIKQESDSKL